MNKANYEVNKAPAPASLIHAGASALPQMGRPAGLPANDTLRPIRRVGMIGSDATGVAIAMHLLDADIPVTMFDSRREATVQAVALARSAYEKLVAAGQLVPDERDRRMALLTGAANFHHLKDCDLILARLSPEMAAAEKLFLRLDELVKQSAILVTDHAAAGINHLARFTRRPTEVLGMRVSNPADPLVSFDLVRGKETSEEVFSTVLALLNRIRTLSH
ncbi:3-hydroxyacyl-CoA dehydrogenase NAD-binding domain-containing protein [Massilia sp. LXY-6]|uniref:3-hydroxyacyl-CoA dehydrogenase NAD-binding domain-containing protein n=1 Tax=Massilia sp. LXY-6 TaxID=3379823 RepID=UPI003EE26171